MNTDMQISSALLISLVSTPVPDISIGCSLICMYAQATFLLYQMLHVILVL